VVVVVVLVVLVMAVTWWWWWYWWIYILHIYLFSCLSRAISSLLCSINRGWHRTTLEGHRDRMLGHPNPDRRHELQMVAVVIYARVNFVNYACVFGRCTLELRL
jgi:hypothetical protein